MSFVHSTLTVSHRLIGVRLTDNELACLNSYLQSNGYSTLSDFCHSLIDGRFTRKELVEAFKEVAIVRTLDSTPFPQDVNNSLQLVDRNGEITNEIVRKVPAPPPHEGSRTSLI